MKKIRAFTLAEVLITLAVIGVVAALTMPSLMQNINDYTLQKQKDVFSKKWAEGLRRMRADNALDGTFTTQSFVEKMKGYFAITTVCEPNNLESCFSKQITSYESKAEGDVFEVKDLKSASNFNSHYDDSPVYGLKFSDGTRMLISYIPGCQGITDSDMAGSTTKCLLYMYDVNANKSPNAYGGNTGSDSDKDDNEKANMNKGRDMVGNLSLSKGNLFGLSFEFEMKGEGNYEDAATQCGGIDNLPSKNDLIELANKLYNDSSACGDNSIEIVDTTDWQVHNCDSAALQNTPLAQALGGLDVGVWTKSTGHSEWMGDIVYGRYFGSGYTYGTEEAATNDNLIMCKK